MSNFRLAKMSEVIGNKQLRLFKYFGIGAYPTDCALFQGLDSECKYCKEFGPWWLNEADSSGKTIYIGNDENGHSEWGIKFNGLRPMIDYSKIEENCRVIEEDGDFLIVEFGEYPQNLVEDDIYSELDTCFEENRLTPTGKEYHSYILDWDDFEPKCLVHEEYQYEGRKYVRFISQFVYEDIDKKRRFLFDKWLEVSPIRWLVDKKNNVAIAECILGNLPFGYDVIYDGDFNDTLISDYLDNCFDKEIIPSGLGEYVVASEEANAEFNLSDKREEKSEFCKVKIENKG